jgi:membrane-bound lytic murein transglycosylase MltF
MNARRWTGSAFAALIVTGSIHIASAAEPPVWNDTEQALTIDPTVLLEPWHGDLDGMIARGYIRILTVYSRTFYFVDNAVLRGTVVDYGQLLEHDVRKTVAAGKNVAHKNVKLNVVFMAVRRDQLLPYLIAGKGDIAAANLTITRERAKLVDFTAAGRSNVSEVIVTGPASPAIASVEDLSGKELFVRKSSSYYESLTALNRAFMARKKPPLRLRPAPESLEDEDLLEMLNAGLIPLVVADRHIAEFWAQVFADIVPHPEVTIRTGGEIAWAIRKGSPQLKSELDRLAARNRIGTTTGNEILRRYLRSVKYVRDATSAGPRKRFDTLVGFFRKYGEQYNVDPTLMAAQGFQESQLNQAARSRVGAIGVMQLMPATGAEMKVGDVRNTDANIAAGIKYMRVLIDRYYRNEPMTRLNKALFAFASYNAGAARIAKLRKEAARRGLDPNIWFGNVEYVAGERIGQETVSYVGNIFKYYVAYRLVLEQQAAQKVARDKVRGPKL